MLQSELYKYFRQRWFWGIRNQALVGNAAKPEHHSSPVAQTESRSKVTRRKSCPLRPFQ
jgi:hypothetical protein